MRSRDLAYAALFFAVPLGAACSSSPESGDSSATVAGALDGTYALGSAEGSSPFASITFLDATHYSYIARSCVEPQADAPSGDLGEDSPDDPLADDGCVHTGTYQLDAANLTLTDDPSSPGATTVTVSVDEATREVASLVTGTTSSPLVDPGSIGSFNTGGSPMIRTSASTPSSSDSSLVTNSAVASAMQWVNVKMPYCWAINHAHEDDDDCHPIHGQTCDRTGAADNPAWNGFRSDCSGLVSFAWGLAPPGLTTAKGNFTPGVASYIPTQDLQPGDALLKTGHHIVLFEKWTNKDNGEATVIAEPGCTDMIGAYAQEQPWSLGAAPGKTPQASWGDRGTYYAIRKKTGTLTRSQ